MLKSYQFLGYSIPIDQVPKSVQKYLWKQLNLSGSFTFLKNPSKNTFYRYLHIIRGFLEFTPWGQESEKLVKRTITEAAYTMSAPSDLINVALEVLSNNGYELPSFRRLDDIVARIREKVHKNIYGQVTDPLSEEQCRSLDAMLITDKETDQSDFGRIKAFPGKNSLKQMKLWSNRLDRLDSIIAPSGFISKIPHTKIRQFASQAAQLELGDIKDINDPKKRHTLLLCFLHEAK